MVSFASSGLEYAAVITANLSLVWILLRENSCVIFEARVLVVLFGTISCDIILDQSGLKTGCKTMFQISSCSNLIKVLCSIVF